MTAAARPSPKPLILVILAVLLLFPIYYLPIWWVSLTAPNYPVEAFPDGVKIHFHMNGVFNGCAAVQKAEIQEEECLDCVHEMDTINHYVGMYPIAAGGPIENSFSIFLMAMLGVMLLGYIMPTPRARTLLLGGGFALVALWMSVVMFAPGGLKYHNAKYLSARVAALGQAGENDEADLTPGEAVIARLKASLAASGVEPANDDDGRSQKERDIAFLRDAFEASQKSLAIQETWTGSGLQLIAWHYRSSLARYFNDPTKIEPMVEKMTTAAKVLYAVILFAMVVLTVGARRTHGLFHRLLILIPLTLPALFVIEYALWLRWYGHHMNSMGAFTLKPFMPTVFGQGKVAQFTTNSYPHIGFWLMLLFSALLLLAIISERGREAVHEGEREA